MVKQLIFFIWITSSILFALPILSGDLPKKNIDFSAGNLAEIVSENLPLCDAVLIIGKDGTAVLIPAYAFSKIIIEEKNGVWNSIGDNLSPVTNIKDFSEICFQQIPAKYAVSIFGKQKSYLSPFQYRLSNFMFLGESEKNGYTVQKYKAILKKENPIFSNIEKIILTSDKEVESNSKISFEQFYFEVQADTIKSIILNNWR